MKNIKLKDVKNMVMEIFEIALDNDNDDIFVEYAPHTDELSITCYEGKWSTDKRAHKRKRFDIYLDKKDSDQKLLKAINFLNNKGRGDL